VHDLVNVPPLTRAALGKVVVGPAKALGVGFEDDCLPDRVVEAAEEEPGALPLLSYLLTDMWSAMVKRADGVRSRPWGLPRGLAAPGQASAPCHE
jgi:hypothetical protein